MKLRVRIHRQTSRVDLPGEEPSVTDLRDHIKETLLCSADTEFSLSLNGSEPLTDAGQTLSSCGIVSGDLICVILPESAAADIPDSSMESVSSSTNTTSANSVSSGTSSTETQRIFFQPGGSSSVSADCEQLATASSSCWEPMLCSEAEEGQAPLSLELLYQSAQTAGPSDAVMVAANQLMLETGFVPQGCGLKAAEMPAGWRSAGGVYRLQYVHPLCENSVVSVLALFVFLSAATLKVNETVDTIPKLTLNPRSYVTDLYPGNAPIAFKDLKKLSRIFKDQLAYQLIAAARAAMSLPVAFGLAALPPELTLRILRLLDVTSVVRLSSVCKHLNNATDDSTLWRHLYRRDFTGELFKTSLLSVFVYDGDIYKRSHKHRSELLVCLTPDPSLSPLEPPRHLPTLPTLPPPARPSSARIIGGAYDQRPEELPAPPARPRFTPSARSEIRRATSGRPPEISSAGATCRRAARFHLSLLLQK
uniref:F-box protein 7 n=1 Tax=Labrus bergylta TaxID=56723 RepID=A0A3Q3F1Y9_9LABR